MRCAVASVSSDDLQDIARDGEVEPAKKTLVDHHPLAVGKLLTSWRSSDVISQIELADDMVKEAAPLWVVWVKHYRG